MQKMMFAWVLFLIPGVVMAQGQLFFANGVGAAYNMLPRVDAPIYVGAVGGAERCDDSYYVSVFAGSVGDERRQPAGR